MFEKIFIDSFNTRVNGGEWHCEIYFIVTEIYLKRAKHKKSPEMTRFKFEQNRIYHTNVTSCVWDILLTESA